MGSHLRFRRAGAVATTALLTFALVACGSDSSGGGDDQSGSGEPSSTPSPTPTGMTGPWKADPGQADRVQEKLTAAGYECTRSTDPDLDLRLCSIGKTIKVDGQDQVWEAAMRFASDAQGTVILANLRTGGYGKDPDAQEKILAAAVLPESDAAIYAAEGDTLEWGKRIKNIDKGTYLAIKGWAPSQFAIVPKLAGLKTTKEKALPGLQKAKLTCRFSDSNEWGGKRKGLECNDPTFKVKDEDGSIAGARSQLVLVDNGNGIESVIIDGSHAKVPAENARGVKQLVPAMTSVDPALAELGAWTTKSLNGAPHSAYVGQWLVTLNVVPRGGLVGWPYVRMTAINEQLNFDLNPEGVNFEDLPSESVSPSDGMSPGGDSSPSESETPAG
ncbi:hypothetical protein FB561_2997 [Kribbella amoyensis]|uniref:Uncharacterized protein n=2 Tax=Kribbella amoyensis TaxID=996641 RepID=A0A561BSX1_9ACTN|nr:hypothetical protein FB561_2997 [Kribbella amoyensis]